MSEKFLLSSTYNRDEIKKSEFIDVNDRFHFYQNNKTYISLLKNIRTIFSDALSQSNRILVLVFQGTRTRFFSMLNINLLLKMKVSGF